MQERIDRAMTSAETRRKVSNDFAYTFGQLGLDAGRAAELRDTVFELLESGQSLLDIEAEALRRFEAIRLDTEDGQERSLVDVLHEKFRDRAEKIAQQVVPHLADVQGKVLDYGAGDGQVTQLLHEQLGLDIVGVDPRAYVASGVTVPVAVFDGYHVDVDSGTYDTAVLTNTLHHEKDNDRILDELDRIVAKRLVILETVPIGETGDEMEQDKDRTFMNDYLYNRLFHNADVPVPGTFETPARWIERLAEHGWKVTYQEDLGIDQPTIKDRHYLMVFERV